MPSRHSAERALIGRRAERALGRTERALCRAGTVPRVPPSGHHRREQHQAGDVVLWGHCDIGGHCTLQQLFDSVEAKQYKRPDMNEDLRLGFASNDFTGAKWKNLTGTARWSDGTEMVTLDYSHLTSVLWGVCKGFQARLGRRSHKKHGRRPQANHQGRLRGSRTGFGSIAQTLQQAQVRDPSISRGEVKAFLDGLRVNQDRPQRGYNFVPLEPMNQLQVDLADMRAFGGKPYPFMLVAIDALTKKVAAAEGLSREHHRGGHEEGLPSPGAPANVYSDDGAEFKREFKELMDFWDIEKQETRGHAYFAERTIRTIKEAMLRRIAAGAGRRGQWHLMLADILSQINGRKHATTQVAPNLAYSDPEMAEIALRNIERRAAQGDPPGNQGRGYGSVLG